MDAINKDQEVLAKGRRNVLKDVKAELRDQIPAKLAKKLRDLEIGQQVANAWAQGNANRSERLKRQRKLLDEFDEFIDDLNPGKGFEWSSSLHLPTILTICKTFHARMLSALLGIDPPFTVKPENDAAAERVPTVQALMRYALMKWANKNRGIESVADRWIWQWCTSGRGTVKPGWDVEYSKFLDVEEFQKEEGFDLVPDPQTQQLMRVPRLITDFREIERIEKCFDGPSLKLVDEEDFLVIGDDEEDPQTADACMYRDFLTASDLWTFVDRGIFDEEAVEAVIKSGENYKASAEGGQVKSESTQRAGKAQVDVSYDLQRYEIIEAYLKVDVDGSGINSDVIVWVNPRTREILRATYLRRIMPTGRRPFYTIVFHRRTNGDPVGLVEMCYSISKELDAIHNMNMDIGILTSMPFGFYRPTASMNEERMTIEPGTWVPLDNPQADVYIPNYGARTGFGMNEVAFLMDQVQRVTAISDINLGLTSSQGAARTATGARALVGEANANLDVYIRRMNRGWKGVLTHFFHLLQQRLPDGFAFRIEGENGADEYFRDVSREALQGGWDFDLEPNSANSNRQIQIDTSNQALQLCLNPLLLQSGIVTPLNLYEAVKDFTKAMGLRNVSKYFTKPTNITRVFTPEEVANRTLSGLPTPLDPTQDLPGIVEYIQHIIDSDELLGQFNEQQAIQLRQKQLEAEQLLQALTAQKAQAANLQQQQINASQGTQMMQPAAAQPAPQVAQGQ